MVKCRLCGLSFNQITNTHLQYAHGISLLDYWEKFPEAPMESETLHDLRSKNSTEMWKDQDFRNRFSRIISEVWDRPGYREETTKAMSVGLLKVMAKVCADPEHSRMLSEAQIRRWAMPGARERQGETLSKALSGCTFSPDHIKNLSKAQKARWARLTPEEVKAEMERGINSPEARRKAAETNSQGGPNTTESMLWEFLSEKYPGLFIPHWVEPEQIGRRWPDFRSTNRLKIVIESFGSNWHTFSRTEEEIISEYKKLGWTCIVVWANSPEDIIVEWPTLVKRIQEVM